MYVKRKVIWWKIGKSASNRQSLDGCRVFLCLKLKKKESEGKARLLCMSICIMMETIPSESISIHRREIGEGKGYSLTMP